MTVGCCERRDSESIAALFGDRCVMRFAVLAFALVVVFFTDLEWNLVPNAVTYPGIAAGILLSAASGGFIPALLAAAGAGLVLIALRLRTRKDTMPFGPALAAGAVIAVFASNAILRWYLTRML